MATIRINLDPAPYSAEDARRFVEGKIAQLAPEYAGRVKSVTVENPSTVTGRNRGESPDDLIKVVVQRLQRHLSGASRLF